MTSSLPFSSAVSEAISFSALSLYRGHGFLHFKLFFRILAFHLRLELYYACVFIGNAAAEGLAFGGEVGSQLVLALFYGEGAGGVAVFQHSFQLGYLPLLLGNARVQAFFIGGKLGVCFRFQLVYLAVFFR